MHVKMQRSSPATAALPGSCPAALSLHTPPATQRDGTEPMDQAETSPAPLEGWGQGGHVGHTR